MLPTSFTFIDVETTGTSPHRGKIIEIGMIRVEAGQIIDSLNTLINPGVYIPPEITMLTGIRNDQLENAPTFYDIKDRIRELTHDSIFVAHNARFDYSFIKSEFMRHDESFTAKPLCTAKLSKRLFPKFRYHNLDSIIDRFGFLCQNRHRAYDDALVLWEFLQKLTVEFDEKKLTDTIADVMKTKNIPGTISQSVIGKLPEGCGVYIFYDRSGAPLYIGKSINLKERILTHFQNATTNSQDTKIFQAIHSLETIETDSELSALLLESKLIKLHQPLLNRMLRKTERIVVAFEKQLDSGYFTAELREVTALTTNDIPKVLAIYKSFKQAKDTLHLLSKEHMLCKKLLSLENTKGNCFGSQLESCNGACGNKELPAKYNLRFMEAFQKTKIKQWPFKEPIIIKQQKTSFLISHWCILGELHAGDSLDTTLPSEMAFDLDTYKILSSYLLRHYHKLQIHPASQLLPEFSPSY